MTNPTNHFWDSCILARYLMGAPPNHNGETYVGDITKILNEAREGKRRIWISTLLFAEIRPSQLKSKGYGSVEDLFAVTASAFVPIGPTPPILMQAGRLRDHMYYRENMEPNEKRRVLTVPDSIHLATCLHIKHIQDVSDIDFMTLDDGKSKNYEEKAVSLLRFEEYSKHVIDDADVKAVCDLSRLKPVHKQGAMF